MLSIITAPDLNAVVNTAIDVMTWPDWAGLFNFLVLFVLAGLSFFLISKIL